LAAGRCYFARDSGGGRLVGVQQHHPGGFSRITGRNGAADAGAGPGDNGDVSVEKTWHW
jgi:hypothetical protein